MKNVLHRCLNLVNYEKKNITKPLATLMYHSLHLFVII